jgi:hypothetical protein
MATPKKISELPVAGPLTGVEVFPIVQNGGTLQVATSTLATYLQSSLGGMAFQVPSAVSITGGSITGVTITGLTGVASSGANSDITSLSGLTTPLSIGQGGTNATTATNARTNLGLGSIATQAANSVSITGGSITGITDLAIADGGTGASTASAARTNLGLDSASNVTFNTVTDSKGELRSIPQNAQTAAYVLVVADAGKHISITTGGVTLNTGIFSAGDAISIYNNSASNQTITQGSGVTMYLAGTATTGNRTLAQRGICSILCVASNTFVISGAGLT